MREGTFLLRSVTVVIQLHAVRIKTEKTMISRYPDDVPTLQDIGDVQSE